MEPDQFGGGATLGHAGLPGTEWLVAPLLLLLGIGKCVKWCRAPVLLGINKTLSDGPM
jgi:hypothetical protein